MKKDQRPMNESQLWLVLSEVRDRREKGRKRLTRCCDCSDYFPWMISLFESMREQSNYSIRQNIFPITTERETVYSLPQWRIQSNNESDYKTEQRSKEERKEDLITIDATSRLGRGTKEEGTRQNNVLSRFQNSNQISTQFSFPKIQQIELPNRNCDSFDDCFD